MPVPNYERFISPLLQLLAARPEGVTASEAHEAAAAALGLTVEDRRELLPSGRQAIYKNRIGWAHDRLKRGGCSTSPRRGHWQITAAGRELAARYPKGLPDEELRRLAEVDADSRATPDDEPPSTAEVRVAGPQERLDFARKELYDSAARELLDEIMRRDPSVFERVVLELLYKMGYGQSRDAVIHTGRSNDGGIDGVVSLDRLGLENVYVQAKRYNASNTVGAPKVRELIGSLSTHGATKGVLITTSTFTEEAKRTAAGARTAHIALVDGDRLAALLIEHELGVSHETVKIPKLDIDFFDAL